MLMRVNKNPSPKELRQFGWTLIIGFVLLGTLCYWRAKPHAALYLWGIGMPLGLLAVIVPTAAKGIYRLWMGWAFIMGTVTTRIILTLLFFGVITPVAFLFRCMGRDVLRLKRSKDTGSYWNDHRKIEDPAYYKRLF